jgi:hypothetical protein
MMSFYPIIDFYAGDDIPVEFLLVKGALESKGNPTTVSAIGEVGLFQVPDEAATVAGYTDDEMKIPEINTKVFTDLIRERAQSLLAEYGDWFPEGTGWSFWGVQFLMAGIGPHATKHLLDMIGPGGESFWRIVMWVESNPMLMEQPEHNEHWGKQSGRLVAFRVMVAEGAVDVMREIEATGMVEGIALRPVPPQAKGGAGTVALVALGILGGGAVIGGIAWVVKRRRRRRK